MFHRNDVGVRMGGTVGNKDVLTLPHCSTFVLIYTLHQNINPSFATCAVYKRNPESTELMDVLS